MSLSSFFPATGGPNPACVEFDLPGNPPRLDRASRRLTTSHTPTFSALPFERLRSKSTRKPHTHRAKSTDLSSLKSPTVAPIALDEYEALPPSIQRKYFSSVERLRITQQGAAQRCQRQSSIDEYPGRPSQDTTDPSIHSRSRSSFDYRPSTAASSCKSRVVPRIPAHLSATQNYISADQALWFMTLPEKVRRQQFGTEERERLTERCESILHHAAPEWAAPKPIPLRRTSNLSADHLSLRQPDIFAIEEDGPGELPESDPRLAELALESTEHVLPPHDEDEGQADELMTSPVEALPQLPLSRTRSISRISSLTPVLLPPPTLAPPPKTHVHATRHARALSHSFFSSAPRHSPSMPELPLSHVTPTFYHDQETRNRLRQYILSPEKFDEAVEFGFPAPAAADEGEPDRDETDTDPSASETARSSPVMDSDRDDDDNSLDTRGPETPIGPHQHQTVRLRHEDSLDPEIAMPKLSESSIRQFDEFVNREMTVRLTLTRPDLRDTANTGGVASVKHARNLTLRSRISSSESMALKPELYCEDATGIHGAFAMKETTNCKRLRRVLKPFCRH